MGRIRRILKSHHRVHQPLVSPRMVRNPILCRKCYPGQCLNLATADDARQNRKSAASVSARSILRTLQGSLLTYLPLKSVAESLLYILDNCKV